MNNILVYIVSYIINAIKSYMECKKDQVVSVVSALFDLTCRSGEKIGNVIFMVTPCIKDINPL